jgi:PTH1 family peptidyl-tRNA hydrolase
MYLICGLGNPGKRYKNTRHNIGFKFVDEILNNHKFKIIKKDKIKEIYKCKIKKDEYYILKILTFMNLSGPPLSQFIQYYKIPNKNLVVVHDDLDLKVGKIKVKLGGGNGGHKGLQSIDKTIGNLYNRLRIGIGHPGSKDLVNKYVLKKFSIEEKKEINKLIEISVGQFDLFFNNKGLFLTNIASLYRKTI